MSDQLGLSIGDLVNLMDDFASTGGLVVNQFVGAETLVFPLGLQDVGDGIAIRAGAGIHLNFTDEMNGG